MKKKNQNQKESTLAKRRQVRKPKPLSNETIVHNSGEDLWNYLFYGTKLDFYDESQSDESDWYDEGIKWLEDELLDGEMYQIVEENPVYAYTSLGRFANIKYQAFRKLNLQCNSIAGNMTGGAFSMTKLVKQRWGIELNYETLHEEAKKHVHIRLMSKQMKENHGKKTR